MENRELFFGMERRLSFKKIISAEVDMENTTSKKYSQIKHRIKRSQAQAKTLGFFYLLGILAVTVLACLPIAQVNGAELGVAGFWKPLARMFNSRDILKAFYADIAGVIIAVLYASMLLGLFVNVIRSFVKLSWLFKRKASKLYGFNRNMYAMEDLAKIFSKTLNAVICFHLLIAFIAGGIALNLLGIITLAFGVAWHIILTPIVGNVSLYTTEDGITEEKRQVGNFTPILRNVLQLCATGGILLFSVNYATKPAVLKDMIVKLAGGDINFFLKNPQLLIVPILSIALLIIVMSMTSYALGIKEFDSEGARERGRKGYLFASLFAFIVTVAMYVVGMLMAQDQISLELVYIALIAFAMFIIEILLRKYPKYPTVNKDEVDTDTYLEEDEKNYGVKSVTPAPSYPCSAMPFYAPYWVAQQPPQIENKKNR